MKAFGWLAGVWVCLSVSLAGADTAPESEVRLDLDFDPGQVHIAAAGGYQSVSLPETDAMGQPGTPRLPVRSVFVLLPAGAEVLGLSVEAPEVTVATNVLVTPAQPPHPLSSPPPAFRPPDPAVYAAAEAWPRQQAELTGVHRMRGQPVACILAYPVRWIPAEKRLLLAPRMALRVRYRIAPVTRAADAAQPDLGPLRNLLTDLVANPGSVPQPNAAARAAQSAERYEYLIITLQRLAPEFQVLADHRGREYSTRVLSIEDIGANYSGRDMPEKTRNAIRDYVQHFGTQYVVLGGDDSVVPVRGCWGEVLSDDGLKQDERIPTDLYYASLEEDQSWDNDGDGVYGEAGVDHCDLLPDVVVGRIPVRRPAEALAYINKVIQAETREVPRSSMLLMGTRLWDEYTRGDAASLPADETDDGHPLMSTQERVSDAEMWSRRLYHAHIRPDWQPQTLSLLFDTITYWDAAKEGDFPFDPEHASQVLNFGWRHAFLATHGAANNVATEGGPLTWTDLALLVGRADFFYTIACNSGGFDSDFDPCFSEQMLRNACGGALAYFGCSRFGWGEFDPPPPASDSAGGSSFAYAQAFYESVLRHPGWTMGMAFSQHKAARVPSCGSNGPHRWIQFGMNYQGDPALRDRPVFNPEPHNLTATKAAYADRIDVTWSPGRQEPPCRYDLWRARSPNRATAELIAGNLTACSYQDRAVLGGIRYHYWARSILNGAYWSDFSEPDYGTVTASRPLPPAVVSASHNSFVNQVRLTWSPVAGASSFELWRAFNSGSFDDAARIQSNLPGPLADDLNPYGDDFDENEKLHYWIVTLANGQSSDPSEMVRGILGAVPRPANLTASQGAYADKVRVDWTPVPEATSYDFWVGYTPTFSNAVLDFSCSSPPVDDFASPGTRRFYFVVANVGRRTSQPAGPVNGYTSLGIPPPEQITASRGTETGRIVVAWSASPGALRYDLYRSIAPNWSTALPLALDLAVLSHTDTTAFADTPWYYWVRARNATSESSWGYAARGLWWDSTYDDALDASGGLQWASTTQVAWVCQKSDTHDGMDAIESGALDANGGESCIEATVTGPGVVGYWVRVTSSNGTDSLHVKLDGETKRTHSPSSPPEWVQSGLPVPAGEHVVSWCVESIGGATGDEGPRALLDEVTWTAGADAARADLTVTALQLDPEPTTPGQSFTAWVTVLNSGNVAVDSAYLDAYANRESAIGCDEEGDAVQSIGELHPGETRQFGLPLTAPNGDGACTARVMVDSLCDITETNETDNEASYSYWVMNMAPLVYYVDPNSTSPSPPYLSWATAATNIAEALAAAWPDPPALMLVTDGTYTVDSPLWLSKPITVRSVNGPQRTTIRSAGWTRCVWIENADAALEGFTVRDGVSWVSGGGIGGTAGRIANCRIVANRAMSGDGGGLYLANAVVSNCVIEANEAQGHGGGVACEGSTMLRNCLVIGNSATNGSGGGLYAGLGASVENCTLVGNTALELGGGMHGGVMGALAARNCIVHGNRVLAGAASNTWFEAGMGHEFSYGCTAPLPEGPAMVHNVTGSPGFVGAGDYRLTAGSRCFDAGTNLDWTAAATDLAGGPRRRSFAVDIGAYEYEPVYAPDYRVSAIALTPESPGTGAVFCARVSVTNEGTADGDARWLDVWLSRPAPAAPGDAGDAFRYVGTVWAGNGSGVEFTNLTAPGAVGSYTFRAYVNSGALTGELDHANNQATLVYSVIRQADDTDGDGLADSWERIHFRDLTVADATTDYDGDGSGDGEEEQAGTQPTNRQSCLRLVGVKASPSAGNVVVEWLSVTGRTYRLMDSSNLLEWGAHGTERGGRDGIMSETNQSEAPRFYRVRVRKPGP